jgi:peptidoglycan/xylan/chitin deacetylase (PgdA/CDA1 family)
MSGQVLTIHGIAPAVIPKTFCFRNICDADTMARYLESVPTFVPLADAIAGRGDALTIDDAIRGAADAALLARRFGHAVTLFVNPGQVESGAPYAFLVLNAVLDGLGSSYAERQALRRRIKARLCVLTDEQARLEFVMGQGAQWGVTAPEVPAHFRTLKRDELVTLRDAGVALENHGWSHSDHTNLSPAESVREIREGRDWLQRELGVEAGYFASPFGEALPAPEASAVCTMWLAASQAMPAGPLSAHVFNRTFLDLPPPDGASARGVRATGRRLLNLGLARLSRQRPS